MNEILQNRFNKEVLNTIKIIKKEVYNPIRFIRMLYDTGNNAYEAVQRLVTKEITTGIEKLCEKDRLDLSIEAIVIKPEYKALFTSDIIELCVRKLKKLGYRI